jgi:hypothetical protein
MQHRESGDDHHPLERIDLRLKELHDCKKWGPWVGGLAVLSIVLGAIGVGETIQQLFQQMHWMLFIAVLVAPFIMGASWIGIWRLTKKRQLLIGSSVSTPASKYEPATPEGRLPGISFHLLLRLNAPFKTHRQYVFEFGKKDAARLSAYLSSAGIFTLTFTDAKQESYNIQIPIGGDGIIIGEWMYFGCEVGIGGNSTALRVHLNDRTVGSLQLPFRTDPGDLDIPNGGALGSNLDRDSCANFDVANMVLYGSTLPTKELPNICAFLLGRNLDRFVRFSGSQFMKFGATPKKDFDPSQKSDK